jgi:hypothetical protein
MRMIWIIAAFIAFMVALVAETGLVRVSVVILAMTMLIYARMIYYD